MNFLLVLALKLPEATLENDVVSKKDNAPLPKEAKDPLPEEAKKGRFIHFITRLALYVDVCYQTYCNRRNCR